MCKVSQFNLYDECNVSTFLGLYSQSGRTSYGKISGSLEAARFRVQTFPVTMKSERHLGSSTAEMPVKFQRDTIIKNTILRPRDFTRSYG